jgi:HEAT repeats
MEIDPEQNPKTADELFLESLVGDYDDEAAWNAVHTLRQRGTDEVFHLAVRYCQSEIPKHRARGLDVLSQLGAGKQLSERPHFGDSVSMSISRLADPDPLVVRSAAWALAHLKGSQAARALIKMKSCPDFEVRWAVAHGMSGCEEPEAIRTLIELMEDTNDEVRNWATFGLAMAANEDGSGQLGTLDSSEIRDALRKRLADSFGEVRDEAVWGLARRKDRSALRILMERLDSEEWIAGDEMAAAEILGLRHDAPVDDFRKGLRDLLDV